MPRLGPAPDYKPYDAYPRVDVAEVISGYGTFAPLLGRRFSFSGILAAALFVKTQRDAGFSGNLEITQWSDTRHGVLLIE